MSKFWNTLLTIILLLGSARYSHATNPIGNERYTLSGEVKDSINGEVLIGATVYIKDLKVGTLSNQYGFYSITLRPGKYTIIYSFVGYITSQKEINLTNDITQNIELSPIDTKLSEVTVNGRRADENVSSNEMGVSRLNIESIEKVPALLGEVDVIKVIQLLPGVQAAAEGTSAFNVRGGSSDQNLILLDESTVYNASHLMGFFSVFNNDAVKDITLYKGDIPADYGGRLASLLDVRMRDGNKKNFAGSGGIGSISSRLTLEGPIMNERSSFIVSGRRSYADLFLLASSNKELRKSSLYFYDLNLKLNHRIDNNNQLFISAYMGRDAFKNSLAGMEFGNQTLSSRWNHLFSKQLFFNLTVVYSSYDYDLSFKATETATFDWKYYMKDLGAKADFTYYPAPQITTHFGIQSTHHMLSPGTVESGGLYPTFKLSENYSLENAFYITNEHDLTDNISLRYGIRYSWFENIGPATVYNFNANYESTDSVVYSKNKLFSSYSGWEPRAGVKISINENTSVKASYARSMQYIQMASNGTAGTPMDLWFTASPNVKPQISDQYAIGLFRDFFDHNIQASVEVYYKDMQNVIDFKDHASLYLNRKLEGELRFGSGKAYGTEFLVKFPNTKLNGWISYTYSRSNRTIATINDGKAYNAPFDKPNYINVILNYDLSKRVSVGATWIYANGAPATFPTGKAKIGNITFPVYTERNTYRMPDYHRLDLGITIQGKQRPGKLWQGEWVFSIYNVYSRKNAWIIRFMPDEKDPEKTTAQMVYLFPIIPAVTYNFKF